MNRKRNRERRSITGERKREKEREEKIKIFLLVGYGATWGKLEPKTKIKKKINKMKEL